MPIIEITLIEGRTQDQKQALAERSPMLWEGFLGAPRDTVGSFCGKCPNITLPSGVFSRAHQGPLEAISPTFCSFSRSCCPPGTRCKT